MRRDSAPPEVGEPVKHKPGQWVQVERKASEAWARLCVKKPSAAAVLHHLVANMGHQNAVVIPQKLLAKLIGVSDRTVRTAISDLVADKWISVVKLNGPGTVAAYVVNDRVAWGQRRDQLCLSVFSATIVADRGDQDEALLGHAELRRIPTLYPGESQLPMGPGEEPPSQPSIPGMEPDLPSIQAELEARGQQRLTLEGVDQTTGEIYESERIRLGLPEGAELPDPFKAERNT